MTPRDQDVRQCLTIINNKNQKAVIETESSIDSGVIKINIKSLYIKLGIIEEAEDRLQISKGKGVVDSVSEGRENNPSLTQDKRQGRRPVQEE